MKNTIVVGCFFVLTTLSLSATAADGDCRNGSTSGFGYSKCINVNITSVRVNDQGEVLVETSADETQLGCSPYQSKYLQIDPDKVGRKDMYATILQAIAMGRKMTFWVDSDITSRCHLRVLYLYN